MKIVWLEQMTKEGTVSKAARDAIYADCLSVIKLASGPDAFEKWMAENKGLVGAAGLALGGFAANKLITPIKNYLEGRRIAGDLEVVKKEILSRPDMAAHKDKALARFDELVRIAPSVARSPDLVSRILKEKLHSGFTSEDVQRLAQIQAAYTPNMDAQSSLSKKTVAISSRTKTASERRAGETLAAVLTMYKEAGIRGKTLVKALENTLLRTSPAILGGMGVGATMHLVGKSNKKEMEAALAKSFQAAVNGSDPERDGLKENEEKSRQYFQILAHFSPHVALQPEAARSFMSKMTHYDSTGRGAVQVEDIKNLSEIQRNYGGKTSPFFEGLASGAKAFGLDGALRSGVSAIGRPLDAEVTMMARDDMGLTLSQMKDNA